jgi:ASC-1-like (ASCH) protein
MNVFRNQFLNSFFNRIVMDHLAIMKTSWNLLPKIISGEKKIESRWYLTKRDAWKSEIKPGDTIYFKDAGKPVTVKAVVSKVLKFENYSEFQLRDILNRYYSEIAFVSSFEKVFDWAKVRKYCVFIFLKNPLAIEPFEIDKAGYGSACAWITLPDISEIAK